MASAIDVAAVTMVKDEEDIILHTLQALVDQGVGAVLVADNLSTDLTLERLAVFARKSPVPVIIMQDETVGYYQAKKMTALVEHAISLWHPQWIIPFDADEIWLSHTGSFLSLLEHKEDVVFHVPLYTHVNTHLDLPSDNPLVRMAYKEVEPAPYGKVCFRAASNLLLEAGNHGATLDGVTYLAREDEGHRPQVYSIKFPRRGPVEIRHFPVRSQRQYVHKIVNGGIAYKASDIRTGAGGHWIERFGRYEREGEGFLLEEYEDRWNFEDPRKHGFIYDPVRLLNENL